MTGAMSGDGRGGAGRGGGGPGPGGRPGPRRGAKHGVLAAVLRRMLDADLAARASLPPGDEDPLEGIGYAAARLKRLLGGGLARASGWPQPAGAAEALGELARLAELAAVLAAKADERLGRELRAGRVTPVPSAGGPGRGTAGRRRGPGPRLRDGRRGRARRGRRPAAPDAEAGRGPAADDAGGGRRDG
jgi:hypothetical protein